VLAHEQGYASPSCPFTTARASTAARATASSATCAGFLDLLTCRSWAATGHGRCTSSAGSACCSLHGDARARLPHDRQAHGHAIGQRPLLTLGVLLVVVGMQFFTLGLISEMITSHHEERAVAREQRDVHVEEVLS
jgi:hypothetical protein